MVYTGEHALISIYREHNFILATVSNKESYALSIIELLHRIYDIFIEYFGHKLNTNINSNGIIQSDGTNKLINTVNTAAAATGLTNIMQKQFHLQGPQKVSKPHVYLDDTVIKENFSIVYSLLEEIIDFGYPLTTELNALNEVVPPPNLFNTLANKLLNSTGGSNAPDFNNPYSSTHSSNTSLPDGTLAHMPWRKSNVSYSTNEIFFDITETLDCLIDYNSMYKDSNYIVTSRASGVIRCNSKLSGIPDILVTFNDRGGAIIEDSSLHPCIRINKALKDHVLSFVPPDGVFDLMKYTVPYYSTKMSSGATGLQNEVKLPFIPPISCQPTIIWHLTPPILNSAGNTTSGSSTVFCASHTPHAKVSISVNHVSICSLIQSKGTTTTNTSSGMHTQYNHINDMMLENVYICMPLDIDKHILHIKNVTNFQETNSNHDIHSSIKSNQVQHPNIEIDGDHCLYWYIGNVNKNSVYSLSFTVEYHEHMLFGNVRDDLVDHTIIDKFMDYMTAIQTPLVDVRYVVPMTTLSGVHIKSLNIVNESYKPFKGIRTLTKNGVMQIRTNSIMG